uniref:Pescadillo homolog n=1 Tax=Timema poppense TaxID=170557 RepID=A0A7R9D1A8_TIMPO|nr:unnamed protein product [Timema poppensis]
MGQRKKKYQSGEGSKYVTRQAALRMLQLTLKNFRSLCILKGIYPREPHNRKKAQRGTPGIKILYNKKDIQFLMHEPIIWKLRDVKIFARKSGRARALRDFKAVRRHIDNHPVLTLDHIVKERYPTFIDAIRDLDDCLTLCFLFSSFPSLKHVPRDQSALCRRLTVEFMHAVIVSKALRKVFVSIKGYYYQAEIKGQTVTWIVPHHFSFEPQARADVDFKVMSTFVEFYTVVLGFVNFRLYHSLNLYYPPKFPNYSDDIEKDLADEEVYVAERIAALNVSLIRTKEEDQEEEDNAVDEFPDANFLNSLVISPHARVVEFDLEAILDKVGSTDDPEKLEKIKLELERVRALKTLFQGLKFYLNREVPREPLVFIIRCFGGEVSWDRLIFVGATYEEDDKSITHHIIDRPSLSTCIPHSTASYYLFGLYALNLNRKERWSDQVNTICWYYIQPQWVFDSVNARQRLPVETYMIGAILPPHLSPFIDESRDQYIPPEEKLLRDPSLQLEKPFTGDGDDDVLSNVDLGEEETLDKTEDTMLDEKDKEYITSESDDEETEVKEDLELEISSKEKAREEKKKHMAVTVGTLVQEDPREKTRLEKQEYRLREKMIPKKHRRLYKSMMAGRMKRNKEAWLLGKKRKRYEEEEMLKRKAQKKEAIKAALASVDAQEL